MRFLANPVNSKVELFVQFFEVVADHVRQLHVLELVPAALVPRVEVRGVARQRFRPDLPFGPGHELLDPPVHR